MGFDLRDDEVEAWFHLWRVVGFLLGLARSVPAARRRPTASRLMQALRERSWGACPEGAAQARATLALMQDMVPIRPFASMPAALVRLPGGRPLRRSARACRGPTGPASCSAAAPSCFDQRRSPQARPQRPRHRRPAGLLRAHEDAGRAEPAARPGHAGPPSSSARRVSAGQPAGDDEPAARAGSRSAAGRRAPRRSPWHSGRPSPVPPGFEE